MEERDEACLAAIHRVLEAHRVSLAAGPRACEVNVNVQAMEQSIAEKLEVLKSLSTAASQSTDLL